MNEYFIIVRTEVNTFRFIKFMLKKLMVKYIRIKYKKTISVIGSKRRSPRRFGWRVESDNTGSDAGHVLDRYRRSQGRRRRDHAVSVVLLLLVLRRRRSYCGRAGHRRYGRGELSRSSLLLWLHGFGWRE